MSWNQVAFAIKLGTAAMLVFTIMGAGFIGLAALAGYMLTNQTFSSVIIGLLGMLGIFWAVFSIVAYLCVLVDEG